MKMEEFLVHVDRCEGHKKKIDTHYRLNHCVMGMVTEIGEMMDNVKRAVIYEKELDVENLVEELGDFLWYIGLGTNASGYDALALRHGFKLEGLPHPEQSEPIDRIFAGLRSLYSITNEVMALSNPRPNMPIKTGMIVSKLRNCIDYVEYIGKEIDTDLETIMKVNKAKLDARYPDRFSEKKALERDLDKEKSAMKEAMA